MNQLININKEFYVLIILGSLRDKRAQRYHMMICKWMKYFTKYKIPVYILLPDDEKQVKDFGIHDQILYIFDPDKAFLIKNGKCKNKVVYGKNYEVVYPEIGVYSREECVFLVKRINNDLLEKAFLKCMDLKYANFIKNFKKNIDIL